MDIKSLVLMIDMVGIGVGAISLWVIISTSSKVGGQVGSTFNWVLLGILFQMAAIIYTVIFTRLKLFPAPALDIHHALMAIGLIFFVFAAKKFSDLTR